MGAEGPVREARPQFFAFHPSLRTPIRVYPYLGADMDKNEIYWGGGPENATRPQFFSFLNEIYWGWGPAPATRPQFFAFRGGGDGGG